MFINKNHIIVTNGRYDRDPRKDIPREIPQRFQRSVGKILGQSRSPRPSIIPRQFNR